MTPRLKELYFKQIEYRKDSNFYLPDSDYDGVYDFVDNCPSVVNYYQQDSDYDGDGDTCDATPYGDENCIGNCNMWAEQGQCWWKEYSSENEMFF